MGEIADSFGALLVVLALMTVPFCIGFITGEQTGDYYLYHFWWIDLCN